MNTLETPQCTGKLGSVVGHAARRGIYRGGVIANASSLFGSTVVTSLFGFAFWVVAAQLFDPATVGAGGAAISAMQLVATAAMLGLGTLLIGELSGAAGDRAELITTALLTSTSAGLVGGAILASGAQALWSTETVPSGVAGIALFSGTAGVSAALLVLDDATIGLRRASWQFWRNLAFSILKLAALPLAYFGLGLDDSIGLLTAWFAGAVLSIVVVAVFAGRARVRLIAPPQLDLFRRYGGAAFTHHWLNLSSAAPRLLLPVLVAAYLTPATNASFYSALLLISFAYVASTHLGTALFGIQRGDVRVLQREVRRTIKVCVAIAAIALLVFGAGGNLLLSMFGSGYDDAALPLAILALGTFPNAVRSQYIAICRVNGDLGRCAVISSLGSALEILLPFVALAAGAGLVVVACAWVSAMLLESLVLWPAVAAAAGQGSRVPWRTSWLAPRTFAATGGIVAAGAVSAQKDHG
jgi:O-antigen/teichoic acid export membrane protein